MVVTGWLVVAGLAILASIVAHRRGEAALAAMPAPDGERIATQIERPARVTLAVIALALVATVMHLVGG